MCEAILRFNVTMAAISKSVIAFFANFHCTILDVAKVIIGHDVQLGPNVAIYTAGHPLHPVARISGYEYGIHVTT